MKRVFLLLTTFICPLFLGACQTKPDLEWDIPVQVDPEETDDADHLRFDYEEIMTLKDNLSPFPQGGDSWGDYFFQFVSNNTAVRVYDLATKNLVQTVKLASSLRGFVSNCHCNTVCFGTEYYDVDDFFPLIYVSTGYAANGYTGALVYRIKQNNGIFFITLVQTLKFPVVGSSSWTEFVPAGEFAYLFYNSEIFKVPMPKLKDGDMIIDRDSAVETFQLTPRPDWLSSSRGQDRLFHQGKIVLISGVPQSGEASVFIILDLEKRERERIVNFKDYGLTSESESIFVWQGDLCVAFVDRIVRLIL